MLPDTVSNGSVKRLLEAERTCTPTTPLSDSHPELSEEDAYHIQDGLIFAKGEGRVGYKLGFTSRVMREQMGIPSPNYGRLTESMRVDSDSGPIELSELIHPRVEPEVALLVEKDLAGPGLTPMAVYPAIRWAFAALEIVDSRFQNYRFRAEDNTADNSSAARFVLGPPVALSAAPDLRLTGVLLWHAGRVVDHGLGADALGGPVNALVWLANRLGRVDHTLEAGSLVLTGGLTKAHPVGGGGTFLAEFGGLGTVKAHFERSEDGTDHR